MSDKSVIESLSEFGFTDIESKIYVYLLNKHPQTIVEIAREIHIPRSSLYDNILKLIEKGLVQRHVLYKSQKFSAYPTSILQTFIDKAKSKVKTLEEEYTFLESNLSQALLPNANTQVRYYHGAQGFMQMMWNTLSAEKEVIGYSVFGRKDVVGEKFTQRFNEEYKKRNLRDRVITNTKKEIIEFLNLPEEKAGRTYQETRFLDGDILYISGDTTIYNNIFAVTYWKQGEVVGIEIENPEFVRTQKSIFEQMWKIAKPLR